VSVEEKPLFQCPRCHQPAGRQDKFAIHERDHVKVIVKCAECRHRWSVLIAADAGLPDRAS
jgi:DNA-directed RNA polymerase subunit M/transcription elongation factor TFIIS